MIRQVIIALLMAVAWVLLTDRVTLGSYILGFVLSLPIIMLLVRWDSVHTDGLPIFNGSIFTRTFATLGYIVTLLRQIVVSDIVVAQKIISGKPLDNSGMIEIPVGCDREAIGALSAHAITSAPGSFVVDYTNVGTDDQTMIVHTIDKNLYDDLLQEQEQRFEACERILSE